MWLKPIYDRTRADVDLIRLDPTNENNKGTYNYTDLNRIENNCQYVMNLLNTSGLFYIPVKIEVKTNWTIKDIPNIKDINRIRQNIITLQNGMTLGKGYEEIEFSNTLNYIKANILEKDLYLIKRMLETCKKELRKCNTFYCGTNGIDLYAIPKVKFIKIKRYVGMIYCGKEQSL